MENEKNVFPFFSKQKLRWKRHPYAVFVTLCGTHYLCIHVWKYLRMFAHIRGTENGRKIRTK